MKFTKEQKEAIEKTGSNIIVSAGAGSGKTKVLTERVIHKLKQGFNINRFLILTFTNLAASEMKDRIREAIYNNPSLKEQLDYIDSAYITTFDSYAMSIVKKYHYLLGIDSSVSIIDEVVVDNIRNKLLEEIFKTKYKEKDEKFLKLISDLTIKDDNNIKDAILRINTKIDRMYNSNEYLTNYIKEYYSEKSIKSLIDKYYEYINKLLSNVIKYYEDTLACLNEEQTKKYKLEFEGLYSLKNYDDIKRFIDNISFKRVGFRNMSVEYTLYKEAFQKEVGLLKSELIYRDEQHIYDTLMSTKDYATSIIDIIKTLNNRLYDYKKYKDIYEYNDIAKMAIRVVEENPFVRDEIKNSFDEIMIDEYQDTNDLQEAFISNIQNNNVYMVGDVKQSIYRFRNANPEIFKKKYTKYSKNDGGIKIDLLDNFRSREEVINDINVIFDLLMDEEFGAASYKENHRMIYGNKLYEVKNEKQNYNLEIYNYSMDGKTLKYYEYEAFIIASDIKEKIKNKYQVLDKEELRDVNYSDFCILLDRGTHFDVYSKIFENMGVPLMINYDEKITFQKEVSVIKNIIDLILKIRNNEFDKKFKYNMYSICRSYLFNILDEEYAQMFIDNSFKKSDIYIKCNEIAKSLDSMSSRNVIETIIEKFNMYEKAIEIGDIEKRILRLDYLKSLADDLSNMGYSIIDFNNYIQDMILLDYDIRLSSSFIDNNSVKLMNIHKSKGLEFKICYYAGLGNKFNKEDIKQTLDFDSDIGFIIPFYDDGVGQTIAKTLYKKTYNKEDISEKIRLLYVAFTRAKEKMIVVCNLDDKENSITFEDKIKYNSFLDMIKSVRHVLTNNIVDINLDYDEGLKYNDHKYEISDYEKLNVREVSIGNEVLEINKASKRVNKLISKEEYNNLKYGIDIHKYFETTSFINSKDETINKLLSKLGDISKAKIYKEYEFIDFIDGIKYHGVIDLMIEHKDYIDIIDYKLKDILDEAYKKQLNIYKKVIHKRTNKNVDIFLYSVILDELEKV